MSANIELSLVVPVTVHPAMFAWGGQCLRYSVLNDHPDVKTNLIDLRYNAEFANLWTELRAKFDDDVTEAMQFGYKRMKAAPPNAAYPNERTFHFLATFLTLVDERPPLPSAFGKLEKLLDRRGDEARAFLVRTDEILERLLRPAAGTQLVVGVSTYMSLLMDALHLARRVRKLFPDAKLLMGGDPFDVRTSVEVVKNKWLDGCVVGPGEYALNDILAAVKAGADVRTAFIPRLANEAFVTDVDENLKKWNVVLDTRSDYDAVKGYHGVEWNGSTNAIHILGRRGCAWAVCTFCQRMHVITREFVFDPSMSLMQREIGRLIKDYYAGDLASDPRGKLASRSLYHGNHFVRVRHDSADRLTIRFDADDADVPAVIKLISWLKDLVPEGKVVQFYSYAPARQMARRDVHWLIRANDPSRLDLTFGIPIETLNPKTTITMKKGGNPIDSIKAMKVADDSGVRYNGLYFQFYPMETLEDIREEVVFVNRALHLVAGHYQPNVYVGSYRDAIGQNPAAYQLELHKEATYDPLMVFFGMNVGASNTCTYKVLGNTPLARLQNDHLSLMVSVGEVMVEKGWRRIAALGRAAWRFPIWLLRMCRLRDFSYLRRSLLMLAVMTAPPKKYKLFVRDGAVIRERPRLLGGNLVKKLSDVELRMLRFLYTQRKEVEVLAEFEDTGVAQRVLDDFRRLGFVVDYGNMVMSTVNDPEGLELILRDEDLAQLHRKQRREDNGEGLVRLGRQQKNRIAT